MLRINGDVTKTVNLQNKSKRSVKFRLECDTDHAKNGVTFEKGVQTMKAKEVLPIEVRFNPKNRMPKFSHEIRLVTEDGNES